MLTLQFPNRVLAVTIAVAPDSDSARLAAALEAEAARDNAFSFEGDPETTEFTLRGLGELELDEVLHRLKTEHGFAFKTGAPQVGYLERPNRTVTCDYTHKRLRGRVGEFARLIVEVSPSGSEHSRMEIRCPTLELPESFHASIQRGLETALQVGPLLGEPVVGVVVAVTGAAWHAQDSTPLAFEIAARAVLREAVNKKSTELLEPYVRLTVECPEEYASAVIKNLHARRSTIEETEFVDRAMRLTAVTPVATLFGYVPHLRSITQGNGTCAEKYAYHAPLPRTDDGPENFPPAIGMRA